MLPETPQRERASAPRGSEQYTPPAREPISEGNVIEADAHGEGAPPADPLVVMSGQEVEVISEEQKITDVVNQVVIHTHAPMENLPELPLPELKVVGRCITFKGETLIDGEIQQMYYEGLVGTINKDTVSLIHVHRFTEDDFKAHYQREMEETQKESAEAAAAREAQREEEERRQRERSQAERTAGAATHSVVASRPYDTFRDFSVHGGGGYADFGDGVHVDDPEGEFGGLTTNHVQPHTTDGTGGAAPAEEHGETNRRVRNRLRNHTGSMGPIPFVTFSRANIHQVQFGRDPRSDFYSLFQDPTKKFFDMQCLRMFCRRYIIHTAQGNNPRQIPLRAFVTCRCHCPDLDNDLLTEVTREEIAHLVKISRDFKRTRKARRAREIEANAQRYEAPPGIFQQSGILHAFKVPQRFFIYGIVLIVLAILTAVVYGVIQMNIDPNVIWYYGRSFIGYVVAAILVWAVTGVLTIVMSTRVAIPVNIVTLRYGLWLLILLGTLAVAVLCVVMLARALTVDDMVRFLATTTRPIRLEAFYQNNHCSGFTRSCTDANLTYLKCDSAAAAPFQEPCRDYMMKDVQKLMIPVVVFAAVAAVIDFFALLTLYKATNITQRAANGEFRGQRGVRR